MNAVDEVLAAVDSVSLFGDSNDRMKGKLKYRRLLRSVHPDLFADANDKLRANDAFARLTELWEAFNGKARVKPASAASTSIISSRKHEYVVKRLGEDDVFEFFSARFDKGASAADLFIAKNSDDADLVDNFVAFLKTVKTDVDDEFKLYFPELFETFKYKDASHVVHPTVATNDLEDFFTLREVIAKHPKGLDGRNFCWVFRRMLVCIGLMHDVGWTHGGPTVDAFHVNPSNHGVVLRGLQYTVPSGEPLKAIAAGFKSDYPAYVLEKKAVDYRADVHLVARAALRLLGETDITAFRAFLKGCLVSNPPVPGVLLTEFDEVMDKIYGERKFVTFAM